MPSTPRLQARSCAPDARLVEARRAALIERNRECCPTPQPTGCLPQAGHHQNKPFDRPAGTRAHGSAPCRELRIRWSDTGNRQGPAGPLKHVLKAEFSRWCGGLRIRVIAKLPDERRDRRTESVGIDSAWTRSTVPFRLCAGRCSSKDHSRTQSIAGRLMDEMSGSDWMSRGSPQASSARSSGVHKLEQPLGPRTAGPREFRREMGPAAGRRSNTRAGSARVARPPARLPAGTERRRGADNDFLDRHVGESRGRTRWRSCRNQAQERGAGAGHQDIAASAEQYVMKHLLTSNDMNLKEIACRC